MVRISDVDLDNIRDLGFDEQLANGLDCEAARNHDLGRVVAVHRDRYAVSKGGDDVLAELAGRFIYRVELAADLPTVGDWVLVDFYDADTHAIIHDLVLRKSLLRRKTAGKSIDYQLIGANIDVAFIVRRLTIILTLAVLSVIW